MFITEGYLWVVGVANYDSDIEIVIQNGVSNMAAKERQNRFMAINLWWSTLENTVMESYLEVFEVADYDFDVQIQ